MPHDKRETSYSNRPIFGDPEKKKTVPDYLLVAQELDAFTLKTIRRYTKSNENKSMRFLIGTQVTELAGELASLCAGITENYPKCRDDYLDRKKDIRDARKVLRSLRVRSITATDVLKIDTNTTVEWASLMKREKDMLSRVEANNEKQFGHYAGELYIVAPILDCVQTTISSILDGMEGEEKKNKKNQIARIIRKYAVGRDRKPTADFKAIVDTGKALALLIDLVHFEGESKRNQ